MLTRNLVGKAGRWPGNTRAFTLIELLVVVGVIAILAGLLLPVLSRTKARALGAMCVNNMRHITLAWNMYANDANDRLVYNLGLDRRQPIPPSNRNLNWVDNVMTWELDDDNTNTAFIVKSPLGPYLANNATVFCCPSDRVLSAVQQEAGWNRRVRSVAMNAMVGDAGPNVKEGGNILNPGYQQFLKLSDIRKPSNIFVILDEHPDSIGDGYFYNSSDDPEWIHLPASYHNKACNFSFADGHVESHRWKYTQTFPPNQPDAAPLPFDVAPDQQADFQWVSDRMSVER